MGFGKGVGHVQNGVLARVFFDGVQKDLHLGDQLGRIRAFAAIAAKLQVHHRGQGVGLDRHGLYKVLGLLRAGAAKSVKMIRPPQQTCLAALFPIARKARIDKIAPLRRFDIHKAPGALGHLGPIDLALVARNIQALNRVALKGWHIEPEIAAPEQKGGQQAC